MTHAVFVFQGRKNYIGFSPTTKVVFSVYDVITSRNFNVHVLVEFLGCQAVDYV